jgi:AraC-like DNA-binding protein
MLHISYGYFAKLFKAVIGKTFKEYLFDVRMSHAHNLLITSSNSVTEIASICGYDNLSYFVSEYKKTFGRTPKAVQKESNYKRLGDK